MILKFWKIEAAGNDFVMIDGTKSDISVNYSELAKKICHRKFGIGGDGLIAIVSLEGYDFEMQYYNPDGSGPAMCGNGARAALRFVHASGICVKDEYFFHVNDGDHYGKVKSEQVAVTIRAAQFQETLVENEMYLVDTGVQHLVWMLDDIDRPDFIEKAIELRWKYTTNVNGVARKNGVWHIRTYEKGVENETLACGTGATASAQVLHKFFNESFPVNLQALGGKLSIDQAELTWLYGPANKVFEGSVEVIL